MSNAGHRTLTLSDTKQSAWQMASIQMSGWTSLPILATSILILQTNSLLGAVLTIIVANAILWFIRLGIITMSYEKRQSTLDISREYLGQFGNYSIAILLLLSTFVWFVTQTTSASNSITKLLPINENPNIDQFIQVSVLFGIISTLFCMGGMALLRKLSTISFPILIVLFFVIWYVLPSSENLNENPLSLSGLSLVLAMNLGITADLPTFFRHSESWEASIKALTIVQVLSLGLGLFSLALGSMLSGLFEIDHVSIHGLGDGFLKGFIIVFIFLSVVCANVSNVYAASVGWELVAPKGLVGRKELFILGLGLTTVFILIADLFSLEPLLKFSDDSLVNLSMVLLSGYIISRQFGRSPNRYERNTYFTAWIVSTALNYLQIYDLIPMPYPPITISCIAIGAILLFGIGGRMVLRRSSS